MKRLKHAVVIAAAWGCSGAAYASGLGIADFDWAIFDNAGGSVEFSENQIHIEGGNSGVPGETGVSTVAATDLDIVFDWEWVLLDTEVLDWGFYFVNDEQTIFTPTSGTEPPKASGTDMFNVNAGDEFGFGVETFDGGFGPGILTITNIKAVPSPSGAAVFALAGLTAVRRRRTRRLLRETI